MVRIVKLALVSTPRSGNTWLRLMVGAAYGLETVGGHDPYALDWARMPERCIVQVHWPAEEGFVNLLDSAGFKVLTIARHPLDVLVSILHFCGREPQTSQWLLGAGGNEDDLHFKAPTDPEFSQYALGPRAAALLDVSAQWWQQARAVIKVRYEDLVGDPVKVLRALEADLGPPTAELSAVVAAHAIQNLAKTSSNQHFWQGRVGLWRSLVALSLAQQIATEHASIFETLRYDVPVGDFLTLNDLQTNWARVA